MEQMEETHKLHVTLLRGEDLASRDSNGKYANLFFNCLFNLWYWSVIMFYKIISLYLCNVILYNSGDKTSLCVNK